MVEPPRSETPTTSTPCVRMATPTGEPPGIRIFSSATLTGTVLNGRMPIRRSVSEETPVSCPASSTEASAPDSVSSEEERTAALPSMSARTRPGSAKDALWPRIKRMESGNETTAFTGSEVRRSNASADRSQPVRRRRESRVHFLSIMIRSFLRNSLYSMAEGSFSYAAHFYEGRDDDNLQAISFTWFLLFNAYDIIVPYGFIPMRKRSASA